MAHDYGASGKVVETLLECAQGVDVDVVGGLVEQQHVTLLLEGHGQMEAVALATREDGNLLLLVCAHKVEARQVGTGVDIASAHAERLNTLRDYLVDALLGEQVVVSLVHIGYLDGLAHLKRACIGLLLPHDEAEEGGLAGSVGADHAHDAALREREGEVLEELFLAESLRESLHVDYLCAQTGTVGNEDFQTFFLLLLVFVEQTVVAAETCLTLGLTCLGGHAYPFELTLEGLAALGGLFFLLCHALGLLVEP